MKFGAMIPPRISDWKLGCEVEDLGYDSVWIADSQMLWSDCYAVLALVAERTSRIRVGTGVTNSVTRLAPSTANAIASINQLAPGRTFIGIGTGFSSMAAMGQSPGRVGPFGDYLRVLRGLLNGEEVMYGPTGHERPIRFLEPDLGFINVADPVQVYVAANGPKALAIAGAYGDGCITATDWASKSSARHFERVKTAIHDGAQQIGRATPPDYSLMAGSFVCILRPGETLASERVIDEVGALSVVGSLHGWWEIFQKTGTHDHVPTGCQDVWHRYLAYLASLDIGPDRMFQRVHQGHATYLHPDERQFMTPEIIRAGGGLIGKPDEIIALLKDREAAGLTEVVIMPDMARSRAHFSEFKAAIIDRY